MGLLSSAMDFVTGIPGVGDVANAAFGHASSKSLQNDSQEHDATMFVEQAKHDKEMFELESDFNSAEAAKAYDRQRQFYKDAPGLQMAGLKSAGLNPILAATGGFKTASGGSQQASASASSSARGSGGGVPAGSRLILGETAKRYAEADLIKEQRNTEIERQELIRQQSKHTGNKVDITEPVARIMDQLVKIAEGLANQKGQKQAVSRLEHMVESSRQDIKDLWKFLVNTYGNAQKAFEEIRRNKSVINLPDINVKKGK